MFAVKIVMSASNKNSTEIWKFSQKEKKVNEWTLYRKSFIDYTALNKWLKGKARISQAPKIKSFE